LSSWWRAIGILVLAGACALVDVRAEAAARMWKKEVSKCWMKEGKEWWQWK
jgi:hypothetical protein